MGIRNGFVHYIRQETLCEDPVSRMTHFHEFHTPLPLEDRRNQGARCMDCGVPFCQSGMTIGGMTTGCPLHNLIPEWNDLLCRNHWEAAYHRLVHTNSFPEFTGRVCPALCEAACTCNLPAAPVTIRENERSIIEWAFAHKLTQTAPPSIRTGKRVAVVGSGPSGLAAAQKLNHRGHSVTVFERHDRCGGLLMYGIPNMKLEKSVVQRRLDQMAAEGVVFVPNTDVGKAETAQALLESFDAVLLCCGSSQPRDLTIPGREGQGICFAVDYLRSTTRRLLGSSFAHCEDEAARDRDVLVIGGGDTGNDCVATVLRQGCRSVTQLEMQPKPPDTRAADNPWPQWPRICKTDYGQEEAIAQFSQDPRIYQTTVQEFLIDEDGHVSGSVLVSLEPSADPKTGAHRMVPVEGSERTVSAQLVLLAAGFTGAEAYVTQAFGVDVTPRGMVADRNFQTNVEKVFVAGDMRRGQSLVVWGIQEGQTAAAAVDFYLMGYTNL